MGKNPAKPTSEQNFFLSDGSVHASSICGESIGQPDV
jgi:hypothetical protein